MWKLFLDLATPIVGLSAVVVYICQKRSEKKNAAILIVNQIEELKSKLEDIVEITTNNKLDATGIYETLDILGENHWNDYKHLFVGKIDINSVGIINTFYEGVSLIREQLTLAKRLQQQSFFNNQLFLGQDCNMFILDEISNKNNMYNSQLMSSLEDIPALDDTSKKIKESVLKMANQQMPMNIKEREMSYNNKVNELSSVFGRNYNIISYMPDQVRVTIEKELNKLSHVEVIGCSGYKKLKKISKIK